jgi:hypothetical protein
MSKGNFFTGQPVFNQLLKYIPKVLTQQLARKNNTDYYCKHFDSYHHLVAMLFAVFQRCNSLREVTTGMQAWMDRLQHLGIKSYPKRSTLSDSNKNRSCRFFEELYHELVKLYACVLPDSRSKNDIDSRLYLIDSTTIDLFSDIMGGAGMSRENGKRKGGVKAHVLVNPIHQIPSVVYLTASKENDRVFMDKVSVPKGSVLVFDKGYIKYSQWQRWTAQGIYWVSRLSNVSAYQVLEDRPVHNKQKIAGVRSDQLILLGSGTTPGSEVIIARKVVYFDQSKQREFVFVTNHQKFSPCHIAHLYKQRWQIETLFKSIKHNFQLRYFLGDNANAIQIQIWCSLIADLLIKVIQHTVKKRKWSIANLCSMIRMHLGTYVNLMEFLKNPERSLTKKSAQLPLIFNSA